MSRRPFGFDADAHERHHWWRSVLLKLSVCGVVMAFLWFVVGGTMGVLLGMLVAMRFLGQALAPDLVALGATLWRSLRALAFRPVQGKFYQFKGHRMRVEDDELLRQRWIALDDLATALGSPIPAVALRRRWPEALREQRDGAYVVDDVALAWLSEQRNDRAGRLRLWVERDVWHPARGRKASYAQKKGATADAPSD